MTLKDLYSNKEDFRNDIIQYLQNSKELADKAMEEHSLLDIAEKENLGLLIRNCQLTSAENNRLTFAVSDNLSKIRIGDQVFVYDTLQNNRTEGEVIDISIDSITISVKKAIEPDIDYFIELKEIVMLDTYISALEGSVDNRFENDFLEKILGMSPVMPGRFLALTKLNRFKGENLNNLQKKAVEDCCKRPSLYAIQGPPGTGKTKVLSDIAYNYANQSLEVAIIAHTHFAVNNALNYIKRSYPTLTVIKIGKETKTEGLDGNVMQFNTLNDYLAWKKQNKHTQTGMIIGMTLQASSVNLGLRKSSFKPSLLLIDEASQIPFAEGSVVGCYNAGTIVFIGDDKQMPPIFLPDLKDSPLSQSIFEVIKNICKDNTTILTTTYRMNSEITNFVSKRYYEPYGITLIPHESNMNNKIDEGNSIEIVLTQDRTSEDSNIEEAQKAVDFIKKYIDPTRKIAVVTPFRRQVNLIRQIFTSQVNSALQKNCIIDTVERLQGQDVDVAIVSFSASDPKYYYGIKEFVENHNRLNVIFSRAKQKIVILKSDLINI